MRLLLVPALAVVFALSSCGQEPQQAVGDETLRGGKLVSVGQPIRPEAVDEPTAGTRELRAPGFDAIVVSQPPDRRRDACVMSIEAGGDLLEADAECDVLARGTVAAFIAKPAGSTAIFGMAGPGVRVVTVDGPGGRHRLPLSAHRAFMVVYDASAHGRVRLTWRAGQQARRRTFRVPPSARTLQRPQHRRRRPGAVFNDEIGKPILDLSRRQVVRRYGRPVATRRRGRRTCTYYEVVGYPNDNWEFCFNRTGRMVSAGGNQPIPPRG
jgi:hypothetical protein